MRRTLLLLLVMTGSASAQAPRLVKDINTRPLGSDPRRFAASGSFVYFAAQSNGLGEEPWRSDGTAGGTTLVADLCAGPCSSSPGSFHAFSGELYFAASEDGGSAQSLWAVDASGRTRKVADLCSGGCTASIGSAGPRLFVVAAGAASADLWVSDGTPAGTSPLARVCSGDCRDPFGSLRMQGAGSQLFAMLSDRTSQIEMIWTSDGTVAGTRQVCVRCGLGRGMAEIPGGIVYAAEGPEGIELWASDGATSYLVRDINSGPADSSPHGFLAHGGRVYFYADNGIDGGELWSTDGAPSRTRMIKDLEPGSASSWPWAFTPLDATRIVFEACTLAEGCELWTSDGTDLGTSVLDLVPGSGGFEPYSLVAAGPGEIWIERNQSRDVELWRSDGTVAGTRQVALLPPVGWNGPPADLTALGGRLLFSLRPDGGTRELWMSDGTNTGMVTRINSSSNLSSRIHRATVVGDRLFFAADDGSDVALWVSDGSEAGTIKLRALLEQGSLAMLDWPVAVGDRLFFVTYETGVGEQIWVSDGTPAGTGPVWPGCATGCPRNPQHLAAGPDGRTLYFQADDGERGYELWRSDGTPAGTYLAQDLIPGPGNTWPHDLTRFDGRLALCAAGPTGGYELWTTDGSPGGLTQIADTLPGPGHGSPALFTPMVDALWFAALDRNGLRSLWRSDGSTPGTAMVRDFRPGFLRFLPREQPGRWPLFVASLTGSDDFELWTSDGSAAGTIPLADICPGSCSAFDPRGAEPRLAAARAGSVFAADDGASGLELWVSDGSAPGTRQVVDLCPGGCGLGWGGVVSFGGLAYASGEDGQSGVELVQSDGSPGGTRILADIAPGPYSSYPQWLLPAGDRMYFLADDGEHGYELWLLDAPSPRLLRDATIRGLDPRPDLASRLPLTPRRDLYLAPVGNGELDPESFVLGDARRPLVLYALDGPGELKLAKAPGERLRAGW